MRSLREMKASHPQLQQPYLYAWPEVSGTVRLRELEEGQGSQLLQTVFEPTGTVMKVSADHNADRRLRHTFFELRSWERTQGGNAFALAYPLYTAESEDGQPILAPLFCWVLNLTPAQKHNDGWRVSRMPQHLVHLNPFLLAYWQETFGEDLTDLFQQFVRLPNPGKQQLDRLCRQVEKRLDLPAIPETSQEGEAEQADPPTHGLLYEGLLGLYPNPNTLLLPSLEPGAKKGVAPSLQHLCSPIVPGPQQADAAYRLQQEQHLWVEGHGATGKTALGRHLVHNALGNGQSCLVVSPRVSALREYEQSLEQEGLGRLAFLLRDTAADKALLLSLLRAAASDTASSPENKLEERHQRLSGKIARLTEKLRKPYAASRRTLPNGANWMETVGQYLHSSEQEGKELLGTQLSASDYEFSEEEYDNLIAVIQLCYGLFTKTYTLRSDLSQLSPSIFLRMEKAEAKSYVDEQTAALLDKAVRLQRWYINRQNAYSDQLMAHFEQYYQRFARQATTLGDRIAELSALYSKPFREGGAVGLKVKSVFSNQAKEVIAAREEVIDRYEAIRASFERTPYFDFTFPEADPQSKMGWMEKVLSQFEEKLQRWRMGLRENVQEEVSRLSRKSVNQQLGFQQQVEELEESLDRWVDQVNETGLYHLPLDHKMLTIPKRQRFLEDAMEQLEATRRSLSDFENFYDWQRNWLQLDEKSRRLIKALLKTRPDDWQAAYRTWFLDNVLNQHYQAVLPPDETALSELWDCRSQLVPLMTTHTMQHWAGKRITAFKNWRRRDRKTFQQLTKPKEQQTDSVLELIRKSGEAVSSACPALLMNTAFAVECFHGQTAPFGLVIVEEAASVHPTLLEKLAGLGHRVLFLSPRKPGDGNRLPVELAALDCGVCTLEHFYKPTPGNLLQAVQGTIPEPTADSVYFEQIDGRYDEQAEVNEEEAIRVVSLLNQIEQTPQRTFPSVGIICMSRGQRDKVSDLLLGIKQRRSAGVETIQQLERNGLTVLSIDELGGQHFEVLLLSSTFGLTGLTGEMTAHYHRSETPAFQQQLLQLMNRAQRRVMVLNSIPKQRLDELVQGDETLSAEQLWPAYLAYIRACAQSHHTAKSRLIRGLSHTLAAAPLYKQPMSLLEGIRHYLHPYLSGTAVAVDEGAPLGEPAVVVGQPPRAAILPDGFLGLGPQTGFFWEYQERKRLKEQGWNVLSTWSPNWWRNANLEARQLAAGLLYTEGLPVLEEE